MYTSIFVVENGANEKKGSTCQAELHLAGFIETSVIYASWIQHYSFVVIPAMTSQLLIYIMANWFILKMKSNREDIMPEENSHYMI